MDAHGFTLFDVLLLDLLAKSDSGSARMRDLADAFVLAPSRVTQQIRRLQSQGLVSRSPDPDDRRGVIASITNQGRSRLGPAIKTYAQGIRTHYLNQMSRQQMIALGDSCHRISAAGNPE
jgi:DNA-binding MarR family transcriptional regulator